jgi:hypothetical protein
MRASLLALAVAVAGCHPDLPGPAPTPVQRVDASVDDLPRAMRIGCQALDACMSTCMPGDTLCADKCFNVASARARELFAAVFECALGACSASDGATSRCAGPADPEQACLDCVFDTKQLTPSTCRNLVDPVCSVCATEQAACRSDQ